MTHNGWRRIEWDKEGGDEAVGWGEAGLKQKRESK